MRLSLLMLSVFIFLMPEAYAYLDPTSGSMLLSVVVGVFAALIFGLKDINYNAYSYVMSFFGIKLERNVYPIVFYSEGENYWLTFKPVLEALDLRKVEAIYLTSSKNDKGLLFQSETIKVRYIGEGNSAYTYLNTLEADLCVMTTPGLDVLQIRRSRGVKHYSYLVHSPRDMGLNKLFSYDYFDSVFCSGPHQERSLRFLEKLRQTKEKLLIKAGCPYMDELALRVNEFVEIKKESKVILLAPTWGLKNNIKFKTAIILKKLLDQGYDVIFRAHPQSYIVELDYLNKLKKDLTHYPKLTWDCDPDNFGSLSKSDVLISNFSGVIFDYAFVFGKPVITIAEKFDLAGMEANDLPYDVWEIEMAQKIGKCIAFSELDSIDEIIRDLLLDSPIKKDFKGMRDISLYNYGHSGEVIANELLIIRDEL